MEDFRQVEKAPLLPRKYASVLTPTAINTTNDVFKDKVYYIKFSMYSEKSCQGFHSDL